MSTVYRRSNEPRTDWFRVLTDLNRSGLGNRAVARRLKVPKTRILGWKTDDHEPRHSDGERLIALWVEVTGHAREDVPIRMPYAWSG
ncbi:hypothetical protein [Lysobacter sp. ESA13C]|uniref:hypothetical protein n=1 Tax=Lysobacter sp. ESA13C TaxID=2862676 RepID=UPI001CBE1A09|nr:hypothetical protein [Lysobacter sp. ESA13C]